MNYKILFPVLFVAMVFCGIYVMNEESDESCAVTDGDWVFTINQDGQTATITAYNGSELSTITIPSTVSDGTNSYTVTVLRSNSTNPIIPRNYAVSSIILPDTIKEIGYYAFHDSKATSINIPNGCNTIGENAFSYSLISGTVVIPNTVSTIGYNAFYMCQSITQFSFEGEITNLGETAFGNCTSATISELRIADGGTVGSDACLAVPTLNKLYIGTNVTLSDFAFYSTPIEYLEIGSDITSVKPFFVCTDLTTVVLLPTCTEITDPNAFLSCNHLTTIYTTGLEVTAGSTDNGYIGYYATDVYTCYTITITVNDSDCGTVSDSSIVAVLGTNLSANGSTLSSTVPNQSVTAIPTHYAVFTGWDNISYPVVANRSVTANFYWEYDMVTVYFSSSDTTFGTVDVDEVTVPDGTSISAQGNVLTIGYYTITATPNDPSAEYVYSFMNWSESSGSAYSGMSITAYFMADYREYRVTIRPNNDSWGTVDTPIIMAHYGDTISSYEDRIDINGYYAQAYPSPEETMYSYSFDSWSPSSGTVTRDTTIIANFTRTIRQYTVSISAYESDWGSVSADSVTVNYGTSISISGNVLTIGSYTITATPSASTSEYIYTFDNWYSPSNIVDYDMDVTAYFNRTVRGYLVTISVNNAEYGYVSTTELYADYGSMIDTNGTRLDIGGSTVTAYPYSENSQYRYSFDDWSPSSGTVTGDMTITANFTRTVREYTVSISPNDSTWGRVDVNSVTVPYGTTYTTNGQVLTIGSTLVTATPEQSSPIYTYSFDSWSPSSGTIVGETNIMALFDRDVTTYTVTIAVNEPSYGSVDTHTLTIEYGTSFSTDGTVLTIGSDTVYATPTTATAQYTYALDNWSPSSGMITDDTTITANFIRTLNQYTVTFAVNEVGWGSVSTSSITVDYGTTYIVNQNTVLIGMDDVVATPTTATAQYTYGFDNWSSSSGTITAPTTITANFTRSLNQYTITIQSNNTSWGTVDVTTIVADYGTSISSEGNLLSIGSTTVTATPESATVQYTYTFSSWDGGVGTVTGNDTITANFTRTLNQYLVTIVSNNTDYGTVNATDYSIPYGMAFSSTDNTLTIGSYHVTATPSATTSQYQYSFDGWTPSSGTVTGPTTITANFSQSIRTYTVYFAVNEVGWGSVSVQSIPNISYGTSFTSSGTTFSVGEDSATATPTTATAQYTYGFSDWSIPSGTITDDLTVTANFTRTLNQYTVTILSNNAEWGTVDTASVVVDYGTFPYTEGNVLTLGGTVVTATPTTATAQYTYSFSDWTGTTFSITGDRTITANFSRTTNIYTVYFTVNDAEYGTVSRGSVNAYYGDHPSVIGRSITLSGSTVTATPTTDTAQYDYEFASWTNVPSEIVGETTITANFTRTTQSYTIHFVSNHSDWGTVAPTIRTVEYGTPYSASGETFTLGNTLITATPSTDTAQYTYGFDNWSESEGIVTDGMVITATFTRTLNQYVVTILPNDPTWGAVDVSTITVDYGTEYSSDGTTLTIDETSVIATPEPTSAQYIYSFGNWTPSSGTITGDTTITANFVRSLHEYTVTVTVNNSDWGSVDVQSLVVSYGTSISVSDNVLSLDADSITATPVNSTAQYTYSFGSWSPSTGTIVDDTLITANFVRTVNQYTVSIISNNTDYGAVSISELTVDYGTAYLGSDNRMDIGGYSVLATPTTATSEYQYSFDSWSPSSGTVINDIIITANFSQNVRTYTVYFTVNDITWGSVSESSITGLSYGTTFSVSDNLLTISGTTVSATPSSNTAQYTYGFDSWSPSSGTVTGDTTVTANFTRTLNQYTVTIQSNNTSWGDVDIHSLTVYYGTAYSTNDNFLTIGSTTVTATTEPDTAQYIYSLVSWTPSLGAVVRDVTITANFSRSLVEYTVTIYSNEPDWGTVSPQTLSVEYGTYFSSDGATMTFGEDSILAIPRGSTQEYSYGFDSWSPSSGTILGDTVIYANFNRTLNQFIVYITVNEEGYGTVDRSEVYAEYGALYSASGNELTIGSEIVTATPTGSTIQYSYWFENWSSSAGSITSDMVITATFTRSLNQYTVTIEPNNSYYGTVSPSSVTVDYGTTISSSDNVLNIGGYSITATPSPSNQQYSYSFESWSQNSGDVGGDFTIFANFEREVIAYQITILSNNDYWGSVDVSYALVDYGTQIFAIGNTLNIETRPLVTVTATPSTDTAQYDYEFDSWSVEEVFVTENTTITAYFERTVLSYVVTFMPNNSEWGSVSESSVSVPYGTSYLTVDNEFSVGEYTIIATPSDGDSQHVYSFNSWNQDSGTVTGDMRVIANFSQTVREYTVTILTNNDYGTVNYNSVSAPYNSQIIVLESGRIAIGNIIVTATAIPDTVDTEYWFGEWTFPPGYETGSAVVEDISITANFYSGIRSYDVFFFPTPVGYGTIHVDSPVMPSEGAYSIPYGSTITVVSNELSISDGTTVTATPSPQDVDYSYSFENWSVPAYTVTGDMSISANFSRIANITVSVTVSTPYGHIYMGGMEYTSSTFDVPFPSDVSAIGNELHIWEYVITVDDEVQTEDTIYHFNGWDGVPYDGQVTAGMNITARFLSGERYYTVSFSIADGFGTLNFTSIQVLYNTLIYSENNSIVLGLYTIVATPTEDTDSETYEFIRWDGIPMSGRILEDTEISAKIMRTVSIDAFNIVEIEQGDVERIWSIPEEYLPLMLVIPIMMLIGLVILAMHRKGSNDDYDNY